MLKNNQWPDYQYPESPLAATLNQWRMIVANDTPVLVRNCADGVTVVTTPGHAIPGHSISEIL